jgi:hypothetical protein
MNRALVRAVFPGAIAKEYRGSVGPASADASLKDRWNVSAHWLPTTNGRIIRGGENTYGSASVFCRAAVLPSATPDHPLAIPKGSVRLCWQTLSISFAAVSLIPASPMHRVRREPSFARFGTGQRGSIG